MERKYYLRGLGIGIAVTAIIMGVVTSQGRTMTDQEIIARAKELGMVENTVLADMVDEEPAEFENNEENGVNLDDALSLAETAESTVPEQDMEDMPGLEAEGSDEEISGIRPEDQVQAGGDEADSEADKQTEEEDGVASDEDDIEDGNPEEGQSMESTRDNITSAAVKTITINSGDGSHTVAKKLADAGIVISADTFDEFLCKNGYDKRLRTGTFSIPADASDEQIARIVTGAE